MSKQPHLLGEDLAHMVGNQLSPELEHWGQGGDARGEGEGLGS